MDIGRLYGVLTCVSEDSIIDDKSPLAPPGKNEEEEAIALKDEAYIDGPIKVDYGTNLRYRTSATKPHFQSQAAD